MTGAAPPPETAPPPPPRETQRRPVPRVDTTELDTAMAFLRFARSCVVKKLDGLGEEQVRRRLVGSDTTLLWLVRHLTDVERYWLLHHVAGVPQEELGASAFDDDAAGVADALEAYRHACAAADEVVDRIGDPSAPVAVPVDGERLSLRWVLAHLTSETARHAGHADILREQIDGVTGR